MDDTVSLRCKFCGAPFDAASLKADATYITCGSCGTSQTRIDAKQYLDQMMGQVQAWISKAIPTGVSISQASNIDAVARHNIFSNSVRPAVETEMTELRFGFLSLLSNQLIMMPHRTNTAFRPSHKTEKAFEFNAKAKAVAPLAVDNDSVGMMNNADKMSLAYAMMLNNMKQLAEDKPGRYTLMANNFTEAADSLKGLQKYDVVRERFEALSQIAKGIAFLEEGNAIESRPQMENGLAMLEAAKQKTMTSMDFGSTYLAVDQESTVSKTLMDIVQTALHDPSVNPLQILDILKRVMDAASVVYKSNSPDAGMFKNVTRYNEIFGHISAIFASKAGKNSGIPITTGSGPVLLPFWAASLRYSFTTGTFLNKKSVEVTETLLLPATYATNAESFDNPRAYVTDIFSSRPGGFFDSLKGSEKSISESGEIGNIIKSVAENAVGSRKIVVPVSTKSEAESFILKYLKQCTADDNKLKLIKPTVDKLIYVPCEITDSGISLPSLGKVSPKSVGHIGLIKTLLI
jgi:predicted nucleic acid-binding Zn ribbon protein